MGVAKNRLIIADSESDANLLWATGFFVPDPCIFIQKGARKYLVLSDLEYARAKKEANVHGVISYNELAKGMRKKKGVTFIDYVDAALKKLKIQSLIVPVDFNLVYAEGLRRKRYRVAIGPEPFFPKRSIKRKDEVEAIRKAIRATERAINEAKLTLKKSKIKNKRLYWQNRPLTSERLKQVINVKLMEQGYIGRHTIVAGGKQGADPHCEGSGPLRAHESIVMDVFPRCEKTGYHADVARSVCRGRAPDKLKEMYQAVREAQATAAKKVRHNVDGSTVHRTAVRVLEEHGFMTTRKNGSLQGFIHSTGHGLGLDIHEYPRVSALKNKLLAGQVVTVEPGLYYPEIGGIRIEDDLLVKRGGAEILSKISKEFEIL